MDEDDAVTAGTAPATVGDRLCRAREAAGLSRENIAARTKIAERHLLAIEEDRLSELAGRTYAVGFSRAYARAVGLDEGEVAQAVRNRLDMDEQSRPRAQVETFEPGDPARVPSARLAWSAAASGVLAIVVLLYLFWPSFLSPQGSLPDLLGEEQIAPSPAAAAVSAPASTAVVITATEPRVWVKIYDLAGNQLFQKEMAEGETYALPADASGPMLRTARPDALEITIGGKRVARISDKPETVKDVPISAAALLSRGGAQSPAAGTPAAGGQVSALTVPAPRARARPASATRAGTIGHGSRGGSAGTPDMTPAAAPAAAPVSASAPVADPVPARRTDAVSTVSAPDSTDSD